MESLSLSPTSQSKYESRANKLAKLPISHKWMAVLSYHLSGKSTDWIAEQLNYHPNTVRIILNNEKVIQVRQMLLQETQKEFEALFSEGVKVIREFLDGDNKDEKKTGVELWIKMHGRPTNGNNGNNDGKGTVINLTAEDVVFQILNAPSLPLPSPNSVKRDLE
jgi:hypothetical protein